MSYDVWLVVKDPESDQELTVGHDSGINHTSNTGAMIAEACGRGVADWNGLRASVVAALCVRAIRELDQMPAYYRRHEPENKWGTLESTREFLSTIRDECVLAPAATVRVSA